MYIAHLHIELLFMNAFLLGMKVNKCILCFTSFGVLFLIFFSKYVPTVLPKQFNVSRFLDAYTYTAYRYVRVLTKVEFRCFEQTHVKISDLIIFILI